MGHAKLADRIPIQLYKLTNVMMRAGQNCILDLHKEFNIENENFSCVNGWILHFLYNNQDHAVFQRDVEREFLFTRSTASKIIRLMESKQWIKSESVPEDARLKALTITKNAKNYRDVMREVMACLDSRMLKGFSEEETKQLESFILRMLDNMKE